MKTGKWLTRVLGLVLSIALIFGMMPDMGLTVRAADPGDEAVPGAEEAAELTEEEEADEDSPDAEPEYYPLTVGNVEVTAANCKDIPVRSGKASYDPDTHTLSFKDAVVETYNGVDHNEGIEYMGENLTITGKVTITGSDGYGIIHRGKGELCFEDADVTIEHVQYGGIRAIYGNICVKNSRLDVNVTASDGEGIVAGGDIDLYMALSFIRAKGQKHAIYAGKSFTVRGYYTRVEPKEGENFQNKDADGNPNGGGIYVKNGHLWTEATSVYLCSYSDWHVWVGDTSVRGYNCDDILGDGKVSFDPYTRTLYFDDERNLEEGYNQSLVYCEGDLRIEGKLSTTEERPTRGIYCRLGRLSVSADLALDCRETVLQGGGVTIEGGKLDLRSSISHVIGSMNNYIWVTGGDISLTGPAAFNIDNYSGSYADIVIDGGKIKAEVASAFAVMGKGTELPTLKIRGGEVDVLSDEKRGNAVVQTKALISGGHVKMSCAGGVVFGSARGCTIGDNMRIIRPEGATDIVGTREVELAEKGTYECKVTFDMGGHGTKPADQIVKDGHKAKKPDTPVADGWLFVGWFADVELTETFDFDGEIVKDTTVYAKWYEKGDYELWLGETLVNDTNCGDILGDGTASYDPTMKTLTLNGYNGNGTVCTVSDLGDGNKALIFAKQDLTVRGSANLESSSATMGIASKDGSITLDANLTLNITSDSLAVGMESANGNIIINGGTIDVTATSSLEGSFNAMGLAVGNGKVIINDGDVTVKGSGAGIFTIGGSLELNGGVIDARGTGSTEGYGAAFLLGTMEMNAGTFRASGATAATAFTNMVQNPEYFDIIKPHGGQVGKLNDSTGTIVESDGTTVAKEVEITRKQYTVTFDYNGKTVINGVLKPQKVYAGRPATDPEEELLAEGFYFKGWCTDAEGTKPFDFATPITEDTTLYAKWAEGFTVNFDVGDVPAISPMSQAVEEGGLVTDPGMTDIEGYLFRGWYTDSELTSPYAFTTPVTGSFTLYAKWEKEKRSVTFDLNGKDTGRPVLIIGVDYGDPVAKPEDPTADGFRFMGWFTESTCDNPYDFSQPVKSSITLYARWVDASVKIRTVTFDLNGKVGTAPAAQFVADGETALCPADPVAEGYSFRGWYTRRSCGDEYRFYFTTPVTSDITLYAKWDGTEEVPAFTVCFLNAATDIYGGIMFNAVNGHYETAYRAEAIRPEVEVTGPFGELLVEGRDYSVKYSRNVNVSKEGKPALVTLKGKGNYRGTKKLEFYILPADLGILKTKGRLILPQQHAKDGKPVPELVYGAYRLKAKDLEYKKDKISEATVLELKGKGNFTGSITENFTLLTAKELKAKSVNAKLKTASVVYNGEEQKPELVVSAGGSELLAGRDYLVDYHNNVNAGKAAVVVHGVGEYCGVAVASFTIQPDKAAKPEVKTAFESVGFTPAGAVMPLTVSIGGRILEEGRDYNVKYSKHKKAGTAKYSVRFKGNYKGQKAQNGSYTVTPAGLEACEIFACSVAYKKAGKLKTKVFVDLEGSLLKEKKDYSVKYFTDEECSKALPAKFKLDDDMKQLTLYAQISSTGKGGLKEGRRVVSFTVYRLTEEMSDLGNAKIVAAVDGKKPAKQSFCGTYLEPAIKVMAGGKEVPAGAYTVSYVNNVAKGKATIIVSGKGSAAAGSCSAGFTIQAKDMKDFGFTGTK
ncbi:MAG: InlB B-repeat-containing protein [Lachnospiraceae bacterium]|nr:InlB B-repeat-containing protein [Lachnospiraceae bacterium]